MIALYKGKSVTSRIIRAFNWSEYSHVAWLDHNRTVIEAWRRGGVSRVPSLSTNHTPGTEVDLFSVRGETPEVRDAVREFLMAQVGRKYDYLGVLGFVFRAPGLHRRKKWFCSELVAEAYAYAAYPLLRSPSYKVYPGMLAASPMLRHAGGIVTS